jgi:hypothetical protein
MQMNMRTQPISEEQIRHTLSCIDSVWQELFPVEQERLLKTVIDEVIVQTDHLELRLKIDGMLHATGGAGGNGVACAGGRAGAGGNEVDGTGLRDQKDANQTTNTVASIKIPFSFKHNGQRKLISVKNGAENSEESVRANVRDSLRQPNCDKALLKALAKAWHWQKLLEDGKFSSANALAKKYRLNCSDVCRIMKMNQLSPRIKRAILDGTQPRTMSMEAFKKPWPDDWGKQSKHFGFEQQQ